MRSSRLALVVASIAVVLAAAVGLALFQPWKLWVDDTVDQAAPVGARVVTGAAGVTTVASAPIVPPSTAPASTSAPGPTASTTALPVTTVQPATTAPPVTTFVGIDHATSGTLLFLEDAEGRRFLRLEDLDTSNGPDLFVYLSTNPVDGSEGAFDDDIVNLGRLQGNVGSQNYEIPSDADLQRFASVVIWCDRFNSAFGAAPLR